MALFTALLHYPVYDRNKNTICAQITPLDLHDMGRLSVTYGVRTCFIVNPLEDQRRIAQEIIHHWVKGYGATYNPLRKLAFERLVVTGSLEEAEALVEEETKGRVIMIATDASPKRPTLRYEEVSSLISKENVLLMFGTAWGLHEEVIQRSYGLLEPIFGVANYNHLSVRTASAIILDRLINRRG